MVNGELYYGNKKIFKKDFICTNKLGIKAYNWLQAKIMVTTRGASKSRGEIDEGE